MPIGRSRRSVWRSSRETIEERWTRPICRGSQRVQERTTRRSKNNARGEERKEGERRGEKRRRGEERRREYERITIRNDKGQEDTEITLGQSMIVWRWCLFRWRPRWSWASRCFWDAVRSWEDATRCFEILRDSSWCSVMLRNSVTLKYTIKVISDSEALHEHKTKPNGRKQEDSEERSLEVSELLWRTP